VDAETGLEVEIELRELVDDINVTDAVTVGSAVATWFLTMNMPCPALQHAALFCPQQ
jgi:hypothetical protein